MHHGLDKLFPASPDAWVHASWVTRLFPNQPPDRVALSEMIDDPELRRHLTVLGERCDVRIPPPHLMRSDMTSDAGVALKLLNSDAERFFSLLGHCASVPEIKTHVMGKEVECDFDLMESLLALDLMASVSSPYPDDIDGSPLNRGRTIFEAWLSSCEESDSAFLLLAMDADANRGASAQPKAASQVQAAFMSRVLTALSKALEAGDA